LSAKEDYVLGYSEQEYERLKMQARFMRPYTEKYLRSAGIGQAMSVLDIGAGVGDVSLAAADLVGAGGQVLGIDRDGQALAHAAERARDAHCDAWVSFQESGLDDFSTDQQFDALIGRFILLYLQDPAATIRHLLRFVRPGGIVVFHEIDFLISNASCPPCEIFDKAMEILPLTFVKAGIPADFGRRIGKTFVDAGLPFPTLSADVTAGGGKGSMLYSWVGHTLASVAPRLAALGIPEPDFPMDASIIPEIEAAVVASGSQIMGPTLVGAWTRKPV
jgi:2-polyprenyl-3-methyl-5-hydroxy-6-metoxy-1,4-benzoquinol methylase